MVVLSFIALAIVLLAIAIYPYAGVLALLFLRPVIDWAWEIKPVGNFSVLAIAGFAPVAGALFYAVSGMFKVRNNAISGPIVMMAIFVAYTVLHLPLDIQSGNFTDAIDAMLRLMNAFAGALIIGWTITDNRRYKALLKVLILMALIPAATILVQKIGLIEGRAKSYVGLERLSALHHGTVSIRYYFSIGLLACIAYLIAFRDSRLFIWLSLAVLGASMIFVLYSKSAVLFLALNCLFIVLVVLKPRYRFLGLTAIMAGAYVIGFSYVETVFSREIGVLGDELDSARFLNSRTIAWERFLSLYTDGDLDGQVFGDWSYLKVDFSGGVHNDFFLNLGRYGAVGLVLYIAVLASVLLFAYQAVRKYRGLTKLGQSAVFLLAGLSVLWVIDSVGLHVSMYPVFLFVLFGFITLVRTEIRRAEFAKAIATEAP